MAAQISKILGDDIINNEGKAFKVDDFCGQENSIVGLLFSGHWCPPCREFTPKLVDFYQKMKADSSKYKFEIVYLSCDRSERDFTSYFKTMPWLALPFGCDEASAAMGQYSVRGIPALILLDGVTGQEITRFGREEIEADPEGLEFPYRNANQKTGRKPALQCAM